jgi:3-methyladenine DNA glycosylase/8-oxoguanine DNA glycosylase
MSAAPSGPPFPFGVARRRAEATTLASLVALEFRVVETGHFVPRGGRYDVRPVRRRPLRALRGGPEAMVAAFGIRDGGIEITLLTKHPECSAADVAWGMASARAMVAVDDDPTEFLGMANQHPLVASLSKRFDCRLTRTPTVFETFTRVVIEQLVTVYEAKASNRRLQWIAGELAPGTTLRAAATSQAVLAVPPWRLHAIGIGSKRSRTLREGARRGAALERLREVDPSVAVTKLESLPGVGPWTANLVALSALGWTDAVPLRDFHAPYLITEVLTGEQGDDDAMLAALAPFRPHRARVVELVMQALIADALPGFERMRRPLPRVDPHRREPWKY